MAGQNIHSYGEVEGKIRSRNGVLVLKAQRIHEIRRGRNNGILLSLLLSVIQNIQNNQSRSISMTNMMGFDIYNHYVLIANSIFCSSNWAQ